MPDQILVPTLGESITEATVSKWLKQEGESVDSDEPVVELETDKVNIEVPSPTSGVLSSIKAKEGDTVEVGALLAVIEGEKSKASLKENVTPLAYKPPKKSVKETTFKKNGQTKHESLKLVNAIEDAQTNEEPLILEQVHEENVIKRDVVVSPAAKKMADEAKKAQESEFEKRPWKDPKKKWDQALREYVKK